MSDTEQPDAASDTESPLARPEGTASNPYGWTAAETAVVTVLWFAGLFAVSWLTAVFGISDDDAWKFIVPYCIVASAAAIWVLDDRPPWNGPKWLRRQG